jgi:Ni,Fe-hydrogenase I large subunit
VLLLQARKYLIAHSTGTITISREIMRRQKKQGNQFPHSKKLVQNQWEMKKTDTQIQTPKNEDKLCQRTQ